jgi:hypothetical protein
MTIVDGVVRKRAGQLEPVDVLAAGAAPSPASPDKAQVWIGQLPGSSSRLKWSDVVRPVLASRDRLQERLDRIDLVEAKAAASKVFGYDDERLAASL